MIEDEMAPTSLNEQQVMMLRLLKNPLPDEDFIQMQRLAIKLLAKQLDQEVDKWELENGINGETYEALSKFHFRSSSKHSE
ncbi:MAG: hypothetical protein H7Z13_07450 [Ferruginibacter sp.]|nr:hypothetical protein [Ferruginibacter sp.]